MLTWGGDAGRSLPLRNSRLAAAAAFGVQGLIFISLTTRLPEFSDHWSLSNLQLSGLLLMMVLLAGLGSALAEQLSKRWSSAHVLRLGLVGIAVGVPLLALAPALGVFIAGLAVYGTALGMVDASTNMQAVALEHAYGRPILPSFHGSWTFGGIIGSVITLASAGASVRYAALLAVLPLIALALPFRRRTASSEEVATVVPQALTDKVAQQLSWRPLIGLGVAMVLFYTVDTACSTWGPTYLDHTFTTPARLVALATFPYLVASGLLRLAGDGLVSRFGPVRVLRAGGLLAAAALAVVVFAPVWPIAVLGFALVGAGAAVIAPLSFSAAARFAGGSGLSEQERVARVDTVIARFNQFNYVGALLGAVLTGAVGASSLRIGFAVPMVAILAIWPLAPAFGGGSEPVLGADAVGSVQQPSSGA